MQSTASHVDDYIQEAPADRQVALSRLRSACLAALPGYEEAMQYGMPCYRLDGNVEVSFASQKNYIALYCLKEGVVRDHPELLQGLNHGKGCIRFPKPERMDFEVIRQLLELTFHSNELPC